MACSEQAASKARTADLNGDELKKVEKSVAGEAIEAQVYELN